MSGRLVVVGLGPGDPNLLTPEAQQAVAESEALYGYARYLDRIPRRPGQHRHASDNREESQRAVAALMDAAEGARVAIVSGGDPGVFAMAAAVCAEIENGPAAWKLLDVKIVAGLTAMLAAAARCGAPLGNDFCAISLSDNLKPWSVIERRIDLAAEAGFVIAFYNPRSVTRPWQYAAAMARLRAYLPASTPIVVARNVSRVDEQVIVTTLAQSDEVEVDMASLVIVGARTTRLVARPGRLPLVYTPRIISEGAA